MERRTFLKTTGGIGAAAIAGGLFVSRGAASSLNVSTSGAELTNDDGEVKQVLIDPRLEVSWADLDDAAGAINIFVEAQVEDSGFYPLLRAQPVLLPDVGYGTQASEPGTSGHYRQDVQMSYLKDNRVHSGNSFMGTGWSPISDNGGLIVADAENGRPDYSGASEVLNEDKDPISGVSEGYMQGNNVYDATIPADQPLVNGEYGAAKDANVFDAHPDGTSKTTIVDVRYTIQLLQMSLDHFTAITGIDPVAKVDGGTEYGDPSRATIGEVRDLLNEWYNESTGEWGGPLNNTDHLTDVMPNDITVVSSDGDDLDEGDKVWLTNQCLPAMVGPNADWPYPEWQPSARSADDVRQYESDNPDYPGFISQEVSFSVTVNNESSKGDTSGGGESGSEVK